MEKRPDKTPVIKTKILFLRHKLPIASYKNIEEEDMKDKKIDA